MLLAFDLLTNFNWILIYQFYLVFLYLFYFQESVIVQKQLAYLHLEKPIKYFLNILSLIYFASFTTDVVFPEPCKPTKHNAFLGLLHLPSLIQHLPEPKVHSVSSSLTIFIIIWAGLKQNL